MIFFPAVSSLVLVTTEFCFKIKKKNKHSLFTTSFVYNDVENLRIGNI